MEAAVDIKWKGRMLLTGVRMRATVRSCLDRATRAPRRGRC